MERLDLILVTDLDLLDDDTGEEFEALKAGAECYIEGVESSDDIHQDVNYRVVFEHKGATYVIECLGEAVEEMFEIA